MFKELNKWCKANPGKFLGLLLPFMFTALGSISVTGIEFIQSMAVGSKFGESSFHIKQKKLWEDNMSCLQGAAFNKITNNHNVQIGSLVCKTGDVLISAQRPIDDTPVFRWVGWNDLTEAQSSVLNFNFIPDAYADSITPDLANQSTVLCQYWKGNYLVQVRTNGQFCVTHLIDPHTGQVINSFGSSCNCKG